LLETFIMKNPTDLHILKYIYQKYYDTFKEYSDQDKTRETKNYIPIDIRSVADHFNVDGDIIFGRLYYHLNELYRYKNDDGMTVDFFRLKLKDSVHCIHFSYMASILANLNYEHKKFRTATIIAIISLCIATFSLIIAVFFS